MRHRAVEIVDVTDADGQEGVFGSEDEVGFLHGLYDLDGGEDLKGEGNTGICTIG